MSVPTDDRLRFELIDALRGFAVAWMTVYHLCFDLNQTGQFGWVQQNFYADPFWTWQRTLIVTLFLFCAGLGQAVAFQQGLSTPRFFKRWAQVVGCALLVTLGSYVMYPQSFIYFGVLHGLAVMLLVVRSTARYGRWLWLAGALVFALYAASPFLLTDATVAKALNHPSLNWLGLITRKPFTEDYVPLVPWLGVVWWGVAAGQWLLAKRPTWLKARMHRVASPLTWLGRYSLSWYMLHQLVLIGLLKVLGKL